MTAKKPNTVRQCDPECILVGLNSGMDKIEELRAAEDRDYKAILQAVEDVRETISEIEKNINWYNIKLNRAEIEANEYLSSSHF